MSHPLSLIATALVVLLVAYLFQLWTRHQRRLMIHQERLAALEKGVEVPPLVEQEIRRGSWNVQRLLLLAGLCWISVGVALLMTLNELAGGDLSFPIGVEASGFTWASVHVRSGLRPLALAPIGIGISHIVVYFVGRRREGA
ncbi:MAG TPA: hypothetical protein VFD69_05795 [Vicinamibacterales bacterium]|nr:hypothetical protein [Vicinamibacterales bacterium]